MSELSAFVSQVKEEPQLQAVALNTLAELCHDANKNWWLDLDSVCSNVTCAGGAPRAGCLLCHGTGHYYKRRNVGELLMLCVSELAEAMEAHRKNKMDEHLPDLPNFNVELADLLIRVFDLCGGLKIDIGQAFIRKQEFNRTRADHQVANRKQAGGKAY